MGVALEITKLTLVWWYQKKGLTSNLKLPFYFKMQNQICKIGPRWFLPKSILSRIIPNFFTPGIVVQFYWLAINSHFLIVLYKGIRFITNLLRRKNAPAISEISRNFPHILLLLNDMNPMYFMFVGLGFLQIVMH